MEVVVTSNPTELGTIVADAIEQLVTNVPNATLGLATGSSPLTVYAELIRRHQQGRISFRRTTMFLLDEYVGLPADHPETYRMTIRREFTDQIDVPDSSAHGPDGTATDLLAECQRYEEKITASGGIDLQLLGIGTDGHIGFNEPVSSLASRTRIKTLTPGTRNDNARFFTSPEEVPQHALTQGIGTILEARHLVLVASGATKAEAIAKTVEGPIGAMVPATSLQLHPHATVVVDESAAAMLQRIDYYRSAYLNKPAWQTI